VADICREHGISEATYYIWKKKYSGLKIRDPAHAAPCAGWKGFFFLFGRDP
jgi:transposase-like protein